MGSLAQFVNSYPEFGKIIETIRFDHFLIKNFTEYSTTVVDCYWAFFLISWFLWRLVGIWQPCPTCPVPARQNLTSPLTCQTGLQSQIERVGSNPLFAQNLTSELSLAKSYGFGLWLTLGAPLVMIWLRSWTLELSKEVNSESTSLEF